ncbi:MAG TPA: hypothetical protein VLZ75_04250 [Chitinophagales bacterium]|nr:hypothetical protein [Chitinophagales bacterium]
MKRLFIALAFTITALACKNSKDSSESIVGTWKVSNYQNNLLVEQSESEIKGFERSVRLQREKMIQFSEYTFNKNGSYHLQHSPTDFDKGKWLILSDSLMVQSSEIYHTSDTSIIHFHSPTEATISMTDFTQQISVDIIKISSDK